LECQNSEEDGTEWREVAGWYRKHEIDTKTLPDDQITSLLHSHAQSASSSSIIKYRNPACQVW